MSSVEFDWAPWPNCDHSKWIRDDYNTIVINGADASARRDDGDGECGVRATHCSPIPEYIELTSFFLCPRHAAGWRRTASAAHQIGNPHRLVAFDHVLALAIEHHQDGMLIDTISTIITHPAIDRSVAYVTGTQHEDLGIYLRSVRLHSTIVAAINRCPVMPWFRRRAPEVE